MRNSTRISAIAVAAAAALAALPSAVAPAQAIPPGGDYYVTVSGPLLEQGVTYSPAQLVQMETDAQQAAANASVPTEEPPSAVAAASTPDGFVLWSPGVRTTSYIYNSNNWGLNYARCNAATGCKTIDRWRTQLREYVNGGSSIRWSLTAAVSKDFGSSPVSFSYAYYCGVNVTAGNDVLCAGGGADHSASGAFNPPLALNKSFGAARYNRVFPMVSVSALFPAGPPAVARFRGWDVCNNNEGSIKLCSTAK